MDLIGDLLGRLRFDPPSRLHECRDCGATVDEEAERCPRCGSTEIAHYEFG